MIEPNTKNKSLEDNMTPKLIMVLIFLIILVLGYISLYSYNAMLEAFEEVQPLKNENSLLRNQCMSKCTYQMYSADLDNWSKIDLILRPLNKTNK